MIRDSTVMPSPVCVRCRETYATNRSYRIHLVSARCCVNHNQGGEDVQHQTLLDKLNNPPTLVFSCVKCKKCCKNKQALWQHENRSKCSQTSQDLTPTPPAPERMLFDVNDLVQVLMKLIRNTPQESKRQPKRVPPAISLVQVNPFGKENLSYILDDRDFCEKFTLEFSFGGLLEFAKKVFFNPLHPENANIILHRRSSNTCQIWNGEAWEVNEIKPKFDTIIKDALLLCRALDQGHIIRSDEVSLRQSMREELRGRIAFDMYKIHDKPRELLHSFKVLLIREEEKASITKKN